MKKTIKSTILSGIMVLLSVSIAIGQGLDDQRMKFGFGIKAGANYAGIYDEKAENFVADGKFGFTVGAWVSMPLAPLLALQPEIAFNQKGFESKGQFLGLDYKAAHTSNYVDLPVLLALRPAKWLNIVAGPQFSFLISQSTKLEIGDFNNEAKEEFDKDNFSIRKFTVGLHAGLDFVFSKVYVSPRVGLDFLDNNGDGTTNNPKYKNIYGQLTLGYRF